MPGVKRKITKEKGHPAWRLPGILPGKFVSRGRAFRQHIPVLAKRNRLPADSRYAACRPRLTAAQGTPGRAARHRATAPALPQLGHPRPRLPRTRYATTARLREQRRSQRATVPYQ